MTIFIGKNNLNRASQPKKSIWVAANAGSGKTRNLITRVARILLQGSLPHKILCLTYTNAAAAEMQTRLFNELGTWSMMSDADLKEKLLDLDDKFFLNRPEGQKMLAKARQLFARALESPGGLKIQTIHGFCGSVLRKFPLEVNISPNFKVLDDRKKQIIVQQSLLNLVKSNPEIFDNILMELEISDLKQFINQVLTFRSKLNAEFNLDSFCACFGLKHQQIDPKQELAEIVNGFPNDIFNIVTQALQRGSKTDLKHAEKLKRMKFSSDKEKLSILENIFCTDDGKARSLRSYPSKAAKIFEPRLEGLFSKLQKCFLDYLAKRNEAIVIKKAQVLYDFSHKFFKNYDELKNLEGALDYDDLIIKTQLLLKEHHSKWVLYKLDGGIDHILLDEAQDTAIEQWEMLVALMDDFFSDDRAVMGERTFYAVGDEKQSIYSFQGANIKAFSYMKDFFSSKLSFLGNELDSVELLNSFRSSIAILRFVNEILKDGGGTGVKNISDHSAFHEALPGRVELWPLVEEQPGKQKNNWWDFEKEIVETSATDKLAENIAIEIKKILKSNSTLVFPNEDFEKRNRKILPGDFLILVRSRGAIFKSILKKLKQHDLPIAGSDRLLLLNELAIRDIISLLKFLDNTSDDLSLAEALRSPLLGLSESDLFKISFNRSSTLYHSLTLNLPKHEASYIILDLVQEAQETAPYELIEKILINHRGRLRMGARLGESVNDVLDEFLLQALIYEDLEPPCLRGFLDWLQNIDVPVKRQLSNSSSSIRVMTIHGSKGLESPIVIMPETSYNLRGAKRDMFLENDDWVCFSDKSGYLPTQIRELKEESIISSIEEENRLFYVAVTRAKNWLIIAGVGKENKNKSDDNQTINWYVRSKKALENLTANDRPGPNLIAQEKIIFEHNWLVEKQIHTKNIKLKKDSNFEFIITPFLDEKNLKNFQKKSFIASQMVDVEDDDFVMKQSYDLDQSNRRKKSASYGVAVHHFLQYIRSFSPTDHHYVKDHFVSNFNNGIDQSGMVETAFQEALAVLEKPELHSLFFKSNILNEVEVSGFIDLANKRKDDLKSKIHVSGRIDLIHITESRILIIDFKTNKQIPASIKLVSKAYLAQIAVYIELLKATYPTRKISGAILWTKTAKLMKIPNKVSFEALNYFFHKQVLDDTFCDS